MNEIHIDSDYLVKQLLTLLKTPSPTGYTHSIVEYVTGELSTLGVSSEITNRGAIRALIPGQAKAPARAIAVHLDTIGAIVTGLKENGRLAIAPVGSWSSRCAEGARVTVFGDHRSYRGTILPLKASGHRFGDEVDSQPVTWDNLEIRIDERLNTKEDSLKVGLNVGDFVSIDPEPEVTESGYLVSRHIDGKAGVAVLLAVLKQLMQHKIQLPCDCYFLFTTTEEVGTGAAAMLNSSVSELLTIDMAVLAADQNTSEFGVTIAIKDLSGPFDYSLTHNLLNTCQQRGIPHSRDVFRYYFSDALSAIRSGSDARMALVGYGVDASHGYERTHLDSIFSVYQLILGYLLPDRD